MKCRLTQLLVGLSASIITSTGSWSHASEACPASIEGQTLGFHLSSLDALGNSSEGVDLALRPVRVALLSRAERAFSSPLLSVTDKPEPGPSGDIADYVSIAPYWWPNPSTDDGLPYIRRDGETNPERNSDRFDRIRFQIMSENVQDLALAAHASGEQRFAERANEQVRHWFVEPSTRMNPNLNHAQAILGRNDGRAIGIIDSRILADVIDAVIVLDNLGALDQETKDGFRTWISAYAAWLIQSPFGLEERGAHNNHGTFYDAQLAHFLVYAGRCDLALRVFDDTKARVVSQIRTDGIQPHEAERTRSLHYHAFNAEAFLRTAFIAQMLGVDLYRYRKPVSGSIQRSIQKIASYADRFEEWPYPRLDEEGESSAWRALARARMIDPDDAAIHSALEAMGPGPIDDTLLLLSLY